MLLVFLSGSEVILSFWTSESSRVSVTSLFSCFCAAAPLELFRRRFSIEKWIFSLWKLECLRIGGLGAGSWLDLSQRLECKVDVLRMKMLLISLLQLVFGLFLFLRPSDWILQTCVDHFSPAAVVWRMNQAKSTWIRFQPCCYSQVRPVFVNLFCTYCKIPAQYSVRTPVSSTVHWTVMKKWTITSKRSF